MTNTDIPLPEFDELWNYNKPAETESQFRQILALTETANRLDYRLQLLTQIARTQGLQRQFKEAHKTLNDVEISLTKETLVSQVRYHLERGRIFNSSNEKAMALPFFHRAYDLAKSLGQDHLTVDAAHMIAIAETAPDKKMQWNLKALNRAEKSLDEKAQRWQGSLYNNIGWTYHSSGQFSEALDLFEKALIFREKKMDSNGLRIAKWCVARTLRSLNRIDESLKIQKSLESEFDKLPEKDGYVYEELGELCLLKNWIAESENYFALAYHELFKNEGFRANESQRLHRIKELGRVKER